MTKSIRGVILSFEAAADKLDPGDKESLARLREQCLKEIGLIYEQWELELKRPLSDEECAELQQDFELLGLVRLKK